VQPLALLLALCMAAPAALPATAEASDVLLWTRELHDSGGLIGRATSLSPRFLIRDPLSPTSGSLATIFAWLYVNGSNSGQTFVADATTDSDWPYFSHYLTDGAPNQFWFFIALSSGSGRGSGSVGPEFPGLIITRAVLRLGQVSIASPGSNPNGDGNWTDYVFNATLELYGTGPTPAAEMSWGRLKSLYR